MSVKRWAEISSDPNDKEVLAFRVSTLARARQNSLIEDRITYLSSVARNKDVLDIGVVEHFSASSARSEWLHQHIAKAARSCLGVDILESEVRLLRDKGYNVIAHDVLGQALDRKFEVIIVGDVVEHLENPGALFRNCARMLQPGGRLVISTPNPWYANALLKNSFEGLPFTDSADHVAWFDAGTLCEIASRNELLLDRYAGVRERASGARSAMLFKMAPLLVRAGVRREIFAKTMIYEFVPANESR